MKHAVGDLMTFSDDRLFKEISDGIPYIVQNAVSLDEVARRLYQDEEFRAAEIIRGFAEEEAAKVLILIDVVRCPPTSARKSETLKYFYSHLAKRIYAMICSFPLIASFKELCDLVQSECLPYFLDGPNVVDWIFPNTTTVGREQTIYVDYVRDIIRNDGEYFWNVPNVPELGLGNYQSPDSVNLCRALSEAGAKSPRGLAVIAEIWRDFVPGQETDRRNIQELIARTLDRLTECGQNTGDESLTSLIMSCWSFPLWPLTIRMSPDQNKTLNKLREERALTIQWIQATEAKRKPPPAITRVKVELLSGAYAAWERDIEAERGARFGDDDRRLRSYSSTEARRWFDLPSYARVKDLFHELNEDEHAALLALAWFARENIANWPRIFERASNRVSTLDDGYQIGLGRYWLTGLNRWEEEPRPFSAGQRYRP